MTNSEEFRVLIVDDSQLNTHVLGQILEPQYEVVVATNGLEALEAAERLMPDIILLDVIMPGLSGYEVLTQLKSSDLTKNIPIIFITGLDSIQEEEKGLLLGAVDYITKPFHPSIVTARVKTHLQMSKYIRTIEHLCLLDTLTELPNRRGFDNQLKIEWGRAMREQTPIGLLMVDIDKFKNYNDTYGHPQGDAVLQTLAGVFRKTLNRATDFAARWGGEEFVVLLPGSDLAGSVIIAESLRYNVEQTLIPGTDTSVTISIGAASAIPQPGNTPAQFLSAADQALYLSKNNGRNRVTAAAM